MVVGKNSVIGGGSLVTRNVAPNKVVAGSPAKEVMDVKEYQIKREGFIQKSR